MDDWKEQDVEIRDFLCPVCGGFTGGPDCPDCGAECREAVLLKDGAVVFLDAGPKQAVPAWKGGDR